MRACAGGGEYANGIVVTDARKFGRGRARFWEEILRRFLADNAPEAGPSRAPTHGPA